MWTWLVSQWIVCSAICGANGPIILFYFKKHNSNIHFSTTNIYWWAIGCVQIVYVKFKIFEFVVF